MENQFEAILKAALALSEIQRELLIDELVESLSPETGPHSDEEWLAELERRHADYEKDPSSAIPWEDVQKKPRVGLMAIAIRFLRLARKDLDNANRWYGRQDPGRAQRFANAMSHALQQIAGNPYLWPVYQGPFRWIRVGRFPYILYYRVLDPNTVLIYAVAQTSRRLGYWRKRRPP